MNSEAFDENTIAKDQTIDDQINVPKTYSPQKFGVCCFTYKAHSFKWCLIIEGESA